MCTRLYCRCLRGAVFLAFVAIIARPAAAYNYTGSKLGGPDGTGARVVSWYYRDGTSYPDPRVFMDRGGTLEVERAMINWAAYGDIEYQYDIPTSGQDIAIGGDLVDSGTLAYAYLPTTSDVYYNTYYSWSLPGGSGQSIIGIGIHELGHAFGFGHHSGPPSVMYASFTGITELSIDDINGVQTVYGAAPGITWDPDVGNTAGFWDSNRWFGGSAPDSLTPARVFNGDILVVTTGNSASKLILGGLTAAHLQLRPGGDLTILGETSIRSGGRLRPLGGTLTTDSLSFMAGGTLVVRTDGNTVNTVGVTSAIDLTNATLEVSLSGGYQPSPGDSWEVLKSRDIRSEFNSINVPGADPNLKFLASYDPFSVEVLAALVGDLNFDGVVNGDGTGLPEDDDFSAFIAGWLLDSSGLSEEQAWRMGDMNFDGITNLRDFKLFKTVYSQANPGGSALTLAGLAVPEPSAGSLGLIALIALPWVRRRIHQRFTPRKSCRRSEYYKAICANHLHDNGREQVMSTTAKRACIGVIWMTVILGVIDSSAVFAQAPPGALLTTGREFSLNDKIVSTSTFVWYRPSSGQTAGPWVPLGGRPIWTGEVSFFKDQIKQIMSANIDVMNVHLFKASQGWAPQRTNLFQAMRELREEGYEVPKATPFLDPIISWGTSNSVDVATAQGKDTFVNMFKEFYDQYFSVNTDAQADSYLTRINNRNVLDTWHTHLSLANSSSLSHADVQSRLQAEYGAQHPIFNDNIHMITTAGSSPTTFGWADEQVYQFQVSDYYVERDFNGVQTVQLKPGYWDQNVRDPGSFLPRDGGTHYANAWNQAVSNRNTLDRVYIESWNEYDEGSGIYAGDGQPPYIAPGNSSGNTDTWSNTNDPYQYIKTTAEGARQFNDTPDLDASILWHNFPSFMAAGETVVAQMIVRNDGDVSWTGAENFKLGQNELVDTLFGTGRFVIDDATNEIPTYGGVFRGRPIVFNVELTAPLVEGDYLTHWQMLQEGLVRFGEEVAHTFSVIEDVGDFDGDGNVTIEDFDIMKDNWLSADNAINTNGEVTGDGIVDLADFARFKNDLFPGGATAFAAANRVPEPTTLTPLLAALPAWISYRCGRMRRGTALVNGQVEEALCGPQ